MLKRYPLRLVRSSLAHPGVTIAAMIAVTLAMASGLGRLEIRTDGHALVPPDDPAILADAQIRERFDLHDIVVVLLDSERPDGVYDLDLLRSVRDATVALGRIEGIEKAQLTSLSTEHRDRVYPGTLSFRPFLDPLPENDKLMEILRSDIEAAGIVTGTLVADDRSAAAIMVGVPASQAASSDRLRLLQQIRATIEPFARPGLRIRIVGAPIAEARLGDHILADLQRLVPLALAMIAVVLWLSCRRLWGVLLALGEVAACLLFTFGLMGWLGVPVYLTTAVLPVVLTTLGLADEIHVFWEVQRRLGEAPDGDAMQAIDGAYERLVAPLVLTSVTTIIAFLSFLASDVAPVSSFGLFAAIGIAFCLLWSLTVIPAALARLPAERLRRPVAPRAERRDFGVVALVEGCVRRPRLTLGALALCTVVLALGLPRLVVQDSWVDGFSPGSEIRRDIAAVNEKLHGTHILLAEVAFDPAAGAATATVRQDSGPLLVPTNLEAIGELERFVRQHPQVGGVLGPHGQMTAVAYLWQGRREGTRAIPDSPERVRLVLNRFVTGRGEHRLREVIDESLERGVVTIYLEDANYRDTAELMRAINTWSAEHLEPIGARVTFGGDVAVSQAMIPAIVHTQVTSLLLALLGALATVSLLYRSLATGALVILPAATTVLWAFAAMAWGGMPLGIATSMFCAVTLGVGVDSGIHLYERHRQLLTAGGAANALPQALREAGPAIVVDATAIALGFGLLAFSRVPGNARLGLIVALALGTSCFLTLAGLGAILALRSRSA